MERQSFMETFFFKKRHNLTFEEFDEYVAHDLEKATARAKQLLGVKNDAVNAFNPIIVSTPAKTTETVAPILLYGHDFIRYDLANFMGLFFGEDLMFYCTCTIDHKTSSSFNDRTIEIPYSKVITIETSSRFAYIDNHEHHVFEIKIVLNDLDDIVIPLRIMLVDANTNKEDYLVPKELLDLASDFRAFLRTKIAY